MDPSNQFVPIAHIYDNVPQGALAPPSLQNKEDLYNQLIRKSNEYDNIPPTVSSSEITKSSTLSQIGFGKDAWAHYFGDVGVEPLLPADIQTILQRPCPFWPDKKVEDTHILMLIPQTVDGKPLSLKILGELIQQPKHGNETKFQYIRAGEYNPDMPAEASHWVLMTKDVIPGSRAQSYVVQQHLVEKARKYQVPKILEATTCILMEHVMNRKHLCSDNPWTYTRCQEGFNNKSQLAVGGFSDSGLLIDDSGLDCASIGVVGLLKL